MFDEDLFKKKKPFEGLFHWMTLFVSLFLFFFSTVNPYLIAGRTK